MLLNIMELKRQISHIYMCVMEWQRQCPVRVIRAQIHETKIAYFMFQHRICQQWQNDRWEGLDDIIMPAMEKLNWSSMYL